MSFRTKNVAGPEVIAADFLRMARDYPKLAAESLKEVVDTKIGPETQDEVPVDTTALQGSWTGSDNGVIIEAGHIYIDFGYGMTYAFWVHEIPPPDLAMPGGGVAVGVLAGVGRTAFHRSPTKWKYLEDPLFRHINDVPKLLLLKFDRMMGERTSAFMTREMPSRGGVVGAG